MSLKFPSASRARPAAEARCRRRMNAYGADERVAHPQVSCSGQHRRMADVVGVVGSIGAEARSVVPGQPRSRDPAVRTVRCRRGPGGSGRTRPCSKSTPKQDAVGRIGAAHRQAVVRRAEGSRCGSPCGQQAAGTATIRQPVESQPKPPAGASTWSRSTTARAVRQDRHSTSLPVRSVPKAAPHAIQEPSPAANQWDERSLLPTRPGHAGQRLRGNYVFALDLPEIPSNRGSCRPELAELLTRPPVAPRTVSGARDDRPGSCEAGRAEAGHRSSASDAVR